MTKAKTTRAQLPGQPSDAEPPPKPGTTTERGVTLAHFTTTDPTTGDRGAVVVEVDPATLAPVEPVHDEAGAPPADPPANPQPPEPRLPPVLASFTRIEHVRSLPEVVGDIDTQPVEFAPGSIERFKASETDRRTLEVIALPGMGFAVRAVADTPQD